MDEAGVNRAGADGAGVDRAGVDRAGAYRHCEGVVRTQARNFAYGIRLLPAPKRRALSAVYAFARRIDDIGDDHRAPAADRLARLAEERARLAGPDAHPADPVLTALADAARRHPIPLGAFGELIDGCEADVRGESYDTFDDLLWYCRCVAGAVGRLSLGVFGASDPEAAAPRADALGVALQLTNILRDVREDGENGRVYLPAKDLARFGCTLHRDGAGRPADPPERLVSLIRFEAARAEEWYGTGLRLLPMLDRRSAACAGAMAGIYRRLLKRIAADPLAALERRTSLPAWEKAAVSAWAVSGLHR
ncbi:presqualene diphosphate synthase HpnD [Actinomadura welshii]